MVPDYYRWLENIESGKVTEWTDKQNMFTKQVLKDTKGREDITNRLKDLLSVESTEICEVRRNKLFYFKKEEGKNQYALYMRKLRGKKEKLLFDPNVLDKEGLIAIGAAIPSPDASKVALALMESGSKKLNTKILDVKSCSIEEEIPNTQWLSLNWHEDNSGFFYTRYPEKGSVPEGEEEWKREVYEHKLGEDYKKDRFITGIGAVRGPILDLKGITPDGKKLLISLEELSKRHDVYFVDAKTSKVTEIVKGLDALINVSLKDDYIYFHTNKDAPKWALYRAPIKNPSIENWELVIPEGEHVIEGIDFTKSSIVAIYNENATNTIKQFSLEGKLLRDLNLPSLGAIVGLGVSKKNSDDIFIQYTSFLEYPSIYHFDGKTGKKKKIISSQIPALSPKEYEVKQVWYPSKDVKVPMFIVHKKGIKYDRKNPTILYGYGGFNISLTPSMGSINRTWIEKGGVLAIPNLRGGGEYGEDWHRQGMLENKQNVFDDFAAAAEFLIKNNITSSEYLGINGGSNGGLLTATSLVQHPDMFGAACIQVPVIDMLRYDKFPGSGHFWIAEYGSSSDPNQVEFLLKYSPLHSVIEGTEYPSTMVVTGDHDDHVFVGQAYKMCATLQYANKSSNSILMRVEKNTGHGGGKPVNKIIEEGTDIICFFAKHLNLKLG